MSRTLPDLDRYDTFPKLLLYNAERLGDRPANREKDYGIWQTWTWRQVADEVRALACGLADLGLKRGDKVAIIGDNRPRLYWSMIAAQCLGAVPVPCYQDSAAKEMRFVIDHSEACLAVVENQEQVDKLLDIKDDCPRLLQIVYDEPRGMRGYDQPFLHRYADIQERGRRFDADNPEFFLIETAKGQGGDIAVILYTSGTTGQPKGVVLSFDNVLITARNAAEYEELTENEEELAYLPMAWVGDFVYSVAQCYIAGFCVSCPESGATVMDDLREIGPTFFFAPPRVFENILTTVMIRIEDAGWLKRSMFHYFMAVAKRAGANILDGRPVPLIDRVLYAIGGVLVYGPLKNTLGFSRIRLAYTAGEAIGPDIFVFYRSLGMNLKQLYGQTEAAVYVTVQPDGEVKPDTVGLPAPGIEVKISDDGEVMYTGPGVFQEYYKDPQATAATKTEDGWVRTGDAGFFDQDGHLKIIDRAKDVGKINGGTMFAPKYIENKLKFFPYIKEAVAFGDGRDYTAAIINIDLGAVGNWAERRSLAYASYQELAAKPEVYGLVRESIEQVNRDLAKDPQLAGSQIKRYLLLHKELDADDGELTRTRKVRRSFITEKYAVLIDALYSDADHFEVTTEVTFEDGSTGTVTGDLRIDTAEIAATPAHQGAP